MSKKVEYGDGVILKPYRTFGIVSKVVYMDLEHNNLSLEHNNLRSYGIEHVKTIEEWKDYWKKHHKTVVRADGVEVKSPCRKEYEVEKIPYGDKYNK